DGAFLAVHARLARRATTVDVGLAVRRVEHAVRAGGELAHRAEAGARCTIAAHRARRAERALRAASPAVNVRFGPVLHLVVAGRRFANLVDADPALAVHRARAHFRVVA